MRTAARRISELESRLLPKPPSLGWIVWWDDDRESIADAERRFVARHGRLPDRGYLLAPLPLTEAEWTARYSPD